MAERRISPPRCLQCEDVHVTKLLPSDGGSEHPVLEGTYTLGISGTAFIPQEPFLFLSPEGTRADVHPEDEEPLRNRALGSLVNAVNQKG